MPVSAIAGLTMLVLGESHMSFPDSLLNPLQDNLTKQGAVVHSIGACGAGAADWVVPKKVECGGERMPTGKAVIYGKNAMSTTPIKDLIAKDKPDVVVLIIGDTMGSYTNPVFPKAWAWKSVTSLTKAITETGTKCVWVGPPWGKVGSQYKKDDTRTKLMSSFLASNVAPCTYIDSLTFSKPGEWITTDGQHFTIDGYQKWAKAIGTALGDLPPSAYGKGSK
ncbi:cell division protein FtsQ [Pseudomonas fluorescens]|jgi:hypothetical protein|uniref:SGNH/GDSL hydrolase family protein n=4 Tax=Pseudomonas TaxID=286 RepID=A0A5M9IV75_9PSED|nr:MULTISPECIES: SGNH/GDSL hydrolase family protein [Pseudomonas]AHC32914.1 cell division protein FtsQ [Pseudomonas sp. TKP]AOE65792.1 cell division protein FtsQ [Pseudomonas fluorescens]AOE71493.1 cell division protein FtsQ [Pseudomonas fluorescens]KAA6182279.1 SGNH/GDSL hydrolase family protein [Pseudomonas veronii]KAA8560060.1 hypothetical protein FX985_00095 [Pseudomonas extremaustralis]